MDHGSLEHLMKYGAEVMLKHVTAAAYIAFVIAAWYLADKFVVRLIHHVFKAAEERAGSTVYRDDEIAGEWLMYRILTLTRLTTQIIRAVLAAVMCFVLLDAVGINIKPILAGVGIAGLGISLAAQDLIRDFINGVFIIIEDQYNVNDWVRIGEFEGGVEQFTLRLTRLRTLDGNLVIIPNSSVKSVINYTKDWAYATINVTIPYEEDYARAKEILMQLADDTVNGGDPKIFPEPIYNGITEYAENGVKLRCRIKTAPGYQWKVGYDVREELHRRYTEAGIKFAYPSVSHHFGRGEGPRGGGKE